MSHKEGVAGGTPPPCAARYASLIGPKDAWRLRTQSPPGPTPAPSPSPPTVANPTTTASPPSPKHIATIPNISLLHTMFQSLVRFQTAIQYIPLHLVQATLMSNQHQALVPPIFAPWISAVHFQSVLLCAMSAV